jgi:hypothetical protein
MNNNNNPSNAFIQRQTIDLKEELFIRYLYALYLDALFYTNFLEPDPMFQQLVAKIRMLLKQQENEQEYLSMPNKHWALCPPLVTINQESTTIQRRAFKYRLLQKELLLALQFLTRTGTQQRLKTELETAGTLNFLKLLPVLQKSLNTDSLNALVVSRYGPYSIVRLVKHSPAANSLLINTLDYIIPSASTELLWVSGKTPLVYAESLLNYISFVNYITLFTNEVHEVLLWPITKQLLTYKESLLTVPSLLKYNGSNKIRNNAVYLHIKLIRLLKYLALFLYNYLNRFWYFLIGGAKNLRLFNRVALRLSLLPFLSFLVARRC